MAVLPIRIFGDPALRQKARPVERVTELHQRLVADMLDTMRQAPGVGLAGPQVGVVERIFVWQFEEASGVFVNPVIVDRSSETLEEEEGCLSLPGIAYPVVRAARVKVEGLDADGEPVSIEAENYLARIFQHEIDHLDGVLFIDHLPEDLRKEALRILRDQALGIAPPAVPPPAEETL
jgi:peptide deformylase